SMHTHIRKTTLCSTLLLLLISNLLFAASAEIDKAVKEYHAGRPGQAITILKPLAASGDSDAQYLLGNIIYGLAQSSNLTRTGDAVAWYKMAAAQDSPEASYALGVIYANQWLKSKDPQHAGLAEAWYQKAADLGYEQALGPLMKIAAQNSRDKPASSLSYTNSSFSNHRETEARKEENTQSAAPSKQAPTEFSDTAGTSDPFAEAIKLMQLIEQLQNLH
ncbi:MAG: sel1 repeat family protein, partial [Gammaproteobacteria bacterium]|nr:sel1 repeat family protein [Gammaproteobacteria bacterium]